MLCNSEPSGNYAQDNNRAWELVTGVNEVLFFHNPIDRSVRRGEGTIDDGER